MVAVEVAGAVDAVEIVVDPKLNDGVEETAGAVVVGAADTVVATPAGAALVASAEVVAAPKENPVRKKDQLNNRNQNVYFRSFTSRGCCS